MNNIEQICDIQHKMWSRFISMLTKNKREDGSVLIRPAVIERWEKAAGTEYEDLSDVVKEKLQKTVSGFLPEEYDVEDNAEGTEEYSSDDAVEIEGDESDDSNDDEDNAEYESEDDSDDDADDTDKSEDLDESNNDEDAEDSEESDSDSSEKPYIGNLDTETEL